MKYQIFGQSKQHFEKSGLIFGKRFQTCAHFFVHGDISIGPIGCCVVILGIEPTKYEIYHCNFFLLLTIAVFVINLPIFAYG